VKNGADCYHSEAIELFARTCFLINLLSFIISNGYKNIIPISKTYVCFSIPNRFFCQSDLLALPQLNAAFFLTGHGGMSYPI
jgi:hypothetical protein